MVKDTYYTYKEIMQQPAMWQKEYELLLNQREEIESFISKYIGLGYEIIFSGAGTSAFIGDILELSLCGTRFRSARSVATTDIISHPYTYFSNEQKLLLISFARSGNSPESMGTIRLANSICKEIAHIYITCNSEGELARSANKDNTLLLLLPPETNDESLAMTSSFSTMLFTCMAIANIGVLESQRSMIESLVKKSALVLSSYDEKIREIASKSFNRAIFLGSGEKKGVAEESHLKLQELTDGSVLCVMDSFLGFRHGPKAVVNNQSVLVYLFSSDPDVLRYEIDLVKQINANNKVVAQIAVSGSKISIPGVDFDLEVILDCDEKQHDIYSSIPYVFTAQLLGFYKSIDMGLNPDSPSLSGNISRVVEGVTIYS